MKYSLRFKFFTAISSLIIFFILLSWLLNNLLLEKFYFYNKKNILSENYRVINSLYKGDIEEITPKLEEIEHTKGFRIVIQDKNYITKYDSTPNRREFRMRLRDRIPPPDNQNLSEVFFEPRVQRLQKGETIIENRYDNRLNSNFISLYSSLNNGDFIFMSSPVAAIKESVEITNNFFLITGLVTIIIGSILVVLITKRFTQPILDLSKIAQRMSVMDFSRRYPVKTRDEIGLLGESINSLSEQLQKSILELQEANEKLKEDIERKHKIDEMRKEFISSVSHELKTPIALIQGYAEGLKVNVNEDEQNKNFYCDVIEDEALKMNKLVMQLLELAQIESGEFNLEKSEFDISKLVEKSIKKNDMVFKEKGIEVLVKSKEGVIVNADYDRIEQILMNYINNAINHVGGRKVVEANVENTGRKCRVSVYNSGQHIPLESMDKIWQSFYKVDKARTRAYGGTGLGLSIVRAIQEAHDNSYGAENVEDGVKFWFELDVSDSGSAI